MLFWQMTMGCPNAVIKIYKKNDNNQDVLAANLEDDDECSPFVQVLFQEEIYHFAMVDGDPSHIFEYSAGELEKLKNAFFIC